MFGAMIPPAELTIDEITPELLLEIRDARLRPRRELILGVEVIHTSARIAWAEKVLRAYQRYHETGRLEGDTYN